MFQDFNSELDNYTRRVNALHRKLRVPQDYSRRGLPFHRYPSELIAVPCGYDKKLCLMTPATRLQWIAMKAAADKVGITLLIRWAFRSIDEQALLIRNQLSWGGDIDSLLKWIAAPGYSEHHTGRALDLNCDPPEEDFENSQAFKWLCNNAGKFGFELSYPKNNAYGIIYEPWHWCYQEK